ncbi:MAG: YdcF family protein [Alphaproteobacteria bacterium]
MRLVKTILGYFIILIGAIWAIGFVVFAGISIGMKYRPLESAEAIVALTGGNDRIKEAIRLLQEKKAPRLFISGVNENVTGYHLLKETPPKWQDKIELGYQAKTTRMNAVETAGWIQKNNISSIILVTSFYHMPRSLLEIKEAVPGLKITPYAVFPHRFDQDTKWIHTRYAWQLFLEYHKFFVAYFFKGVVK